MGFSKDDDGVEGPVLTVVGGSQPSGVPAGSDPADKASLLRLQGLRQEHRDLDAAIESLVSSSASDQLLLTRLKKRKLQLRDQISSLEDDLLPDIIA